MNEYKLPNAKHYYHFDRNLFQGFSNLSRAFIMPDYELGMHQQDFFEINLIISGNGVHYIEKNSVKASRGDVFIIPPNTPHGYEGGKGFDVFHLLISNKFMQKYAADLQLLPHFFTLFRAEPVMRAGGDEPLYLTLGEEQLEQTLELLQRMVKHMQSHSPADSTVRTGLALAIIALLCQFYEARANEPSSNDENNDPAFMTSIAYIHENYSKKLSIAQLAKVARLSRSSFIRKFNQICKIPPFEYIMHTRLEAAESMLISTSLPVSEIAERTGFFDAAHFSKCFTAKYNTAPSEYRKSHTIS